MDFIDFSNDSGLLLGLTKLEYSNLSYMAI